MGNGPLIGVTARMSGSLDRAGLLSSREISLVGLRIEDEAFVATVLRLAVSIGLGSCLGFMRKQPCVSDRL